MAGYRMDRTGEDIMRELTAILRTVKDPRVTSGLISIVRVDVTRDLSYATVYVSAMDGLDAAKAAVKGLGNITPEHIGSKGNQGFTGVLLSRFDFDIKDLGKCDKDFQRMLAFGIADENFLFE